MKLVKQQQPQKVIKSVEVAGITMGVLEDGTAFVNARGIASLCGMAISTILHHSTRWREGKRDSELHRHLVANGVNSALPTLYTPAADEGRSLQHAYPDWMVLLYLEFYATDNGVVLLYLEFYATDNGVAADNYRKLAGHALREYIYEKSGYARSPSSSDQWKYLHDRLLAVEVPANHFCVFKEIADIVTSAIRAGLPVDDHTIPDISVGRLWGNQWDDESYDARFGTRQRFEHNYPAYFRQAPSNP